MPGGHDSTRHTWRIQEDLQHLREELMWTCAVRLHMLRWHPAQLSSKYENGDYCRRKCSERGIHHTGNTSSRVGFAWPRPLFGGGNNPVSLIDGNRVNRRRWNTSPNFYFKQTCNSINAMPESCCVGCTNNKSRNADIQFVTLPRPKKDLIEAEAVLSVGGKETRRHGREND